LCEEDGEGRQSSWLQWSSIAVAPPTAQWWLSATNGSGGNADHGPFASQRIRGFAESWLQELRSARGGRASARPGAEATRGAAAALRAARAWSAGRGQPNQRRGSCDALGGACSEAYSRPGAHWSSTATEAKAVSRCAQHARGITSSTRRGFAECPSLEVRLSPALA